MGLPKQVPEEGRFPGMPRPGKDDGGKLRCRLSDDRLQGSVYIRHDSPDQLFSAIMHYKCMIAEKIILPYLIGIVIINACFHAG
jgi:hypothetical protein